MKPYLKIMIAVLAPLMISCEYSKYPLDEKPLVKVDPSLYGIWRVSNDTDKANFILIQDGTEDGIKRRDTEHEYFLTYFNRSGTNRGYENFNAYLSDVKGERFLNLAYLHWSEREIDAEGFLLYRLLNVDAAGNKIQVVMVKDSSLAEARSAGEVREKVTRNLHNKNYYGDTSELYNVAHGHFTQQQAVARARQN